MDVTKLEAALPQLAERIEAEADEVNSGKVGAWGDGTVIKGLTDLLNSQFGQLLLVILMKQFGISV